MAEKTYHRIGLIDGSLDGVCVTNVTRHPVEVLRLDTESLEATPRGSNKMSPVEGLPNKGNAAASRCTEYCNLHETQDTMGRRERKRTTKERSRNVYSLGVNESVVW